MKILYIDPVTGLSGDMLISAIVHLGFPAERIDKMLKRMSGSPLNLSFEEVRENVIAGLRMRAENLDIRLSKDQMRVLVDEVSSSERVRDDIRGMLGILFQIEAEIHGLPSEEVELHELSSIDTVLDLAIFADAVSFFDVKRVYCGPIPHGTGLIKTSHGMIPNPPPLTLELVKGYNSVFHNTTYELTTPTGALIVRYYVKPEEKVPPFRILKVGYGFGSYKMEKPDFLRVILGEAEELTTHEINVIEFDVDDMDMEYTGFFADSLRRVGAKDVIYQPVYMKKGRIGIRFSVFCDDEKLDIVKRLIFRETSTFGIRERREKREILRREEKLVKTPYGDVRVKIGFDEDGRLLKEHFEFEDVVRISEVSGLPYSQVLKEVKRRLWNELSENKS